MHEATYPTRHAFSQNRSTAINFPYFWYLRPSCLKMAVDTQAGFVMYFSLDESKYPAPYITIYLYNNFYHATQIIITGLQA